MSNSSSGSSESATIKPEFKRDIRICCNMRGYCEFIDGSVPRMRAEHWKAFGSSNFQNYISFGAIPSDKATIMLMLDHLDLAMRKFFFKDSQTGKKQAYTFDVNWVLKHTRFKDEGEKPEGNRDTANRIWSTYFSNKQQEQYKSGRDYLEALLDNLVGSKKIECF
ncbi:uncharacterized protein A4U43_C08F12780 [Asparagus officinalis]|nr:uncharacterized protein A4U43_C08F12780 [Asparagus officinalis]